jgi:hypothetical protein
VEEFGAGSGTEGVEAFTESAFKLVGPMSPVTHRCTHKER